MEKTATEHSTTCTGTSPDQEQEQAISSVAASTTNSEPETLPNLPQTSFNVPSQPFQQRRRGRKVNKQDKRVLAAFREGKDPKNIKWLGSRDIGDKLIDYTDCVKYQRNDPREAQPPRGYRTPDRTVPGGEVKAVHKVAKKQNKSQSWVQDPNSVELESLSLAQRD